MGAVLIFFPVILFDETGMHFSIKVDIHFCSLAMHGEETAFQRASFPRPKTEKKASQPIDVLYTGSFIPFELYLNEMDKFSLFVEKSNVNATTFCHILTRPASCFGTVHLLI